MIDDGLYDQSKHGCPIPDIVLGQHVIPLPAGVLASKPGPFMSAADSFKVTIFGRGGHGSQPHRTIDPVLIASHIVVRLQTIVAREVPPDETAVVTVGALQAGSTENVISDEAVLRINTRSVSEEWRTRILASVKRIIKAECEAGNCTKPPTIESTSSFPLTLNDDAVTGALEESFDGYFGKGHIRAKSVLGSEDFGILGSSIERPYCFWIFGGVNPEKWAEMEKNGTLNEQPINHSPFFAPVIQPTLKTGTDAMIVAALTFLKKSREASAATDK